MITRMFDSIDSTLALLTAQNYIAERSLAIAIYLAIRLRKPLFLEGEAGVGKTEIAKVLAQVLQTELIRLQCYEGLDVSTALYEWNYPQQLLYLRMLEASGATLAEMKASLFTREFLQARPLLRALEAAKPPVLLIDELDRADEEFEAFLLEILSDFQVTIPELGTIVAAQPPVVIITSNRTREIHDALKRRCLYFWIDYPGFQKELSIIRAKAPQVEPELARLITAFIQELRGLELFKAPGVAETIDWTTALIALDQKTLSPQIVQETVGVILKYQDDIELVTRQSLPALIERAKLIAASTES
ncbi:MAG: MoxR family ATPase [Anaerolineae bacterium]|nr:MoxR family ATPase [Anaerolineae bacterium]